MLHHVFRHSSLGHLDSELEEFSVQPWCSPEDIGSAHVANQLSDFPRGLGSTPPPPTAFPRPEESKSFSMPSDHRSGLDEQEADTPPGPEPGENDPQHPIGCPKLELFLIGFLQDDELVAERQDFQLQGGSRSQRGRKPDEDRQQHVVHG